MKKAAVNLNVDGFEAEIIGKTCNLMLETERVNQSEFGGCRTSVHGGGMRRRKSFDMSREQLSAHFLPLEQGFKVRFISIL